jgi:hypothetical protein
VAELSKLLSQMGPDETRVMVRLARRLLEGQRAYGKLDLARDPRNFVRERGEEVEDLLIYSAFQSLQREARATAVDDGSTSQTPNALGPPAGRPRCFSTAARR